MAEATDSKGDQSNDKPKWGKRKRGGRKQNVKNRVQADRNEDPAKSQDPRDDVRIIVRSNENFTQYYKAQPFFETAEEFDRFLSSSRDSLPASFRINTFDRSQANFLRNFVQGPQFKQISLESNSNAGCANDQDDEATRKTVKLSTAFEALPWYPNQLAWQMNITRIDLRKNPILQELHKLIMAETENGFISRQETVSMIPPLVLDIHRGQTILDMCAAPGSKTAQLLEYLKNDIHKDENEQDTNLNDQSDDPFDEGMIVANDVDNKRCYMLVHQSSRLNSPNCIIINEDASRLPNMKLLANQANQKANDVKFDRILCDVPCTGDGTMRKNIDVWKKWTVGNAQNLHKLQCKILRRGIELLKEGGLIAYSTCSLNPTEDEAVVAALLRESEGKLALQEINHKLPGLKYKQGISTWIVMDREMKVLESVSEVPSSATTFMHASLFPPSKQEAEEFNLNRCIRILPHLQNTGGFFIAVLKKLAPRMPWEKPNEIESEKLVADINTMNGNVPHNGETQKTLDTSQAQPKLKEKKRRFNGFKEDPFFFMDPTDPDWVLIKTSFGLSDKFPCNQLLHRCSAGKKRSIYLVSKRARDFILANKEEHGSNPGKDFIKIINAGLRLFSRASSEAGFRICQDGVVEILPHVMQSIQVLANKADLSALITNQTRPFDSLSFGQEIRDRINYGSFILIYKHEPESEGEKVFEMPLAAWRGEFTVSLYVSKTFKLHLGALIKVNVQ